MKAEASQSVVVILKIWIFWIFLVKWKIRKIEKKNAYGNGDKNFWDGPIFAGQLGEGKQTPFLFWPIGAYFIKVILSQYSHKILK